MGNVVKLKNAAWELIPWDELFRENKLTSATLKSFGWPRIEKEMMANTIISRTQHIVLNVLDYWMDIQTQLLLSFCLLLLYFHLITNSFDYIPLAKSEFSLFDMFLKIYIIYSIFHSIHRIQQNLNKIMSFLP